jgi:hypothetical protein
MQPIFDNRTIIGYAKTRASATRIVKSKLQNIPNGWIVDVQQRDTSIIELPAGWIYSVHPKYL